jgi:hypothetical protein
MIARRRFSCVFGALFALFALFAWDAVGCAETSPNVTAPPGPSASSTAEPRPASSPSSTSSASAPSGEPKKIYVRDTRADCEGEGPMKCLMVREAEGQEWTLFYGRIEGFKYEEGNSYVLSVTPEGKGYRLVSVVSKHKGP